MASTTTYLGLKLLGTSQEDKAQLFEDWRQDINGENEGSNMQLIDAAFHELDERVSESASGGAIAEMLAQKVDKPANNPNGISGQVLSTNGDGTTSWVNTIQPSAEQMATAINDYLEEHPEAVTTVPDGAITMEKLAEEVQEAIESGGSGASDERVDTLEALLATKIDDGYIEDGVAHFTANGVEKFTLEALGGGGGGGGGSGYSVRIINGLNTTVFTVASTQRVSLPFTYVEYYGTEVQNQNGFMTVQYKYSSEAQWRTEISNQQIPSNVQQTLDVTSLLSTGMTTNIRIICSNGREEEDAKVKTLQFNITCVELRIESSFNSSAAYSGNFVIPYTCVGAGISKTVIMEIDNIESARVDIGTSHNQSLQLPVTMTGLYRYGAHEARLWFVTPDGATSNILTFPIIYDDGSSTAPIIGASLVSDQIESGEILQLKYVCYTPNSERTAELAVEVYGIGTSGEEIYYSAEFTNIANQREFTLPISNYPVPEPGSGSSGEYGYIRMTSGPTVATLSFVVTSIQSSYNLESVTSGLVYSYRAAGYTNNSAGKEYYDYAMTDAAGNARTIHTAMSGFNWVTDGYLDGESLTLRGAARMQIKLPILTTAFTDENSEQVVLDTASGATVTTSGRTMEFEFELSNVTDQNSVVFSCMDSNGVGFQITPQVCYILADGQSPVLDSTGFIENEESIPCAYIKDEKRIRVTFVIQRRQYTGTGTNRRFISYTNIFINGEYANSYLYAEDAIYNGTGMITIGSADCVTKLYDVRLYNRDLTREEVLQNYMNAPTDLRERAANNSYNDVLGTNGDVDYNKAVKKYPCLLFIGRLSNFKKDTQYVGVRLTKPDGVGGYVTEFSYLEQDDSGKFLPSIKVQGTSSQRFMRKNFKVSLADYKKDNEGAYILDGQGKKQKEKKKYVLKGYDSEGNPLSVGESTLCYKMDYMSTDHANTFNANIADTLFNDKPSGSLVQNAVWGFRCLLFNMPQDAYVAGAEFEDYPEGTILFAGDGCLNNDKGNTKSFGLETDGDSGANTVQQKWEFKDNSNPLCVFKTDRLMQKIYGENGTTYTLQARNGLESCYPDEGDLDDAGIQPKYDYIQVLFTWLYQRANFIDASSDPANFSYIYQDDNGDTHIENYESEREYRKAIFRQEFTKHFNLEHALVYYLFIEWVALCDNRAKNMFLSCKDVRAEQLVFTDNSMTIWDCVNMETGEVDASKIDWTNSTFGVWYTDLYDLDSCFGAENSGYLRVPYFADWQYKLGRTGTYQFNGHDSRLWLMFEEAFAPEIKARAQELTRDTAGTGTLNYGVLKQVHITENAELVCPAIVNRDMVYKYEDAWTEGYWDYSVDSANPSWVQTSDYKYLQRGSRTEQKESFIYRRSMMLYSKYECDQFKNDRLLFRCGSAVAKEDTSITLSPVQAMWLGVSYGDSGSATMSGKRMAGETAVITSPNDLGRSDHVYIHGASNLLSVSSLAAFHPYEIGLANAGKLKTLLIGSNAQGYVNGDLSGLDTSSCALLEVLNIQGCTGFTDSPIDLQSNTLIREVYASGSTVPYFLLPEGGILEKLELGRPKRIIILNMPYLTDFSYDDLSDLNMVRVENTPEIQALPLLAGRVSQMRLGIRLIGINETVRDMTVLGELVSGAAKGKRMDANGNLVSDADAFPIITGDVYCTTIGEQTLQKLAEYYPDLNVHYTSTYPSFEVRFYNANGIADANGVVNQQGDALTDQTGNVYIQYVDSGSEVLDPIAMGNLDAPTLPPGDKYEYEFVGWSYNGQLGLPQRCNGNLNIVAQYATTLRKYTVRWYARTTDPAANALKVQTNVQYGSEAVFSTDPDDLPRLEYNDYAVEYNVFSGWDKNTGYVTGDMNVYAKWETATVPDPGTLELNEMSVAQIYGITRRHIADQYWTVKDHVNIRVGQDYDFDDVESQVLANELYFNGSTAPVVTNIKLFGEDAPTFTLAIDYEFTGTTANNTLVSCFDADGAEGFRLRYSGGGPNIQWGNTSTTVGENRARGIVVLRHRAGERILYVRKYQAESSYGWQRLPTEIMMHALTRNVDTSTEAKLVFGASSYHTTGYEDYGVGWVHWCKIWYADLGNTMAGQLASWPHETWKMEYYGAERYRLAGYGTDFCGASFVSSSLLRTSSMIDNSITIQISENSYTSMSQQNPWEETQMNACLDNIVLHALPIQWQFAIRKVRIPSFINLYEDKEAYPSVVTGSEIHYSDARIYLPSIREMGLSASNSYYDGEGDPIPWMTSNLNRLKFAGIEIPETAQVYSLAYDPTLDRTVNEFDLWYLTTSTTYEYTGSNGNTYTSTAVGTGYRMLITLDTARKNPRIMGFDSNGIEGHACAFEDAHGQSRNTSLTDECLWAGDGSQRIWVTPNEYWTRSMYRGGRYYDYIYESGSSSSAQAHNDYGILPCFSL